VHGLGVATTKSCVGNGEGQGEDAVTCWTMTAIDPVLGDTYRGLRDPGRFGIRICNEAPTVRRPLARAAVPSVAVEGNTPERPIAPVPPPAQPATAAAAKKSKTGIEVWIRVRRFMFPSSPSGVHGASNRILRRLAVGREKNKKVHSAPSRRLRSIMKALAKGFAFSAIVALAACSSHKSTIQTSNGTATVTTNQGDKSVTVQTKEGTTAIGTTVDQGKLGAPVYPGASSEQQGSITTSSDKGTSTLAAFKTPDAFDKVYAFYKQQLPAGAEKMKMSSGNGSVASFQVGDEGAADQVTVQVTSDKPSETDILITHVTKSGAAASSGASTAPAAAPTDTPSPESSG
jgi:hypothetical protein